MKFKDWAEKIKKAMTQRVEDASDKKKINENRQAVLKKGIQLANKGAELIKSVEEANKAVSKKVADLADTVAPLAEKLDEKATALRDSVPATLTEGFAKARDAATGLGGVIADKAASAKDVVIDAAGKVAQTVEQKIDQAQKAKASHPSTGSTLLDLAAGAVPETEVTRPKKDAGKPPTP